MSPWNDCWPNRRSASGVSCCWVAYIGISKSIADRALAPNWDLQYHHRRPTEQEPRCAATRPRPNGFPPSDGHIIIDVWRGIAAQNRRRTMYTRESRRLGDVVSGDHAVYIEYGDACNRPVSGFLLRGDTAATSAQAEVRCRYQIGDVVERDT